MQVATEPHLLVEPMSKGVRVRQGLNHEVTPSVPLVLFAKEREADQDVDQEVSAEKSRLNEPAKHFDVKFSHRGLLLSLGFLV